MYFYSLFTEIPSKQLNANDKIKKNKNENVLFDVITFGHTRQLIRITTIKLRFNYYFLFEIIKGLILYNVRLVYFNGDLKNMYCT